MRQHKKTVWISCGLLLAVVLAGGGFWLGTRHHLKATVNDSGLTQSSDPASLSVENSSGATSLGQLGAASQAAPTTGSSSDSSASSAVDNPANFSQYEKYKSNASALFGDIKVGTGTALGINQKAKIAYKGWLTDGTLFDQSQTNASGQLQPYSFTLGDHQIISGLEEGVDGMKVGGTRLVIIPPALGYGAQGQGPVPANAVLVFEVQLLDVQ